MVRVETGGRLHFGFGNLSLANERLYGALGVAVERPTVAVTADPAGSVACDHPAAREYARLATDALGVPGADVTVETELPAHVGLGSGTQLALSVLAAIAHAHDVAPAVREHAPALGRGGRSGVGVAAFEAGGFVLDAGHPTARFTSEPPATGEWTVPPVAARHDVPEEWRFLVIVPDAEPGRSGDDEESTMRRVVERADPAVADRIAGVITRRVLPAAAEGAVERFGAAAAEVGRLNGTWYADEQGGVYRPPVGALVDSLAGATGIYGAGQSSWGPAVYGVTDAEREEEARAAGAAALDEAGVDGDVFLVRGRNRGARVED